MRKSEIEPGELYLIQLPSSRRRYGSAPLLRPGIILSTTERFRPVSGREPVVFEPGVDTDRYGRANPTMPAAVRNLDNTWSPVLVRSGQVFEMTEVAEHRFAEQALAQARRQAKAAEQNAAIADARLKLAALGLGDFLQPWAEPDDDDEDEDYEPPLAIRVTAEWRTTRGRVANKPGIVVEIPGELLDRLRRA